jgi:hypothetical protein
MTRQEIRSLIRNSLPKIDKSNRWHDNYLNGAIEKALAEMYTEVWLMSPMNLAKYTKSYGYVTPVPVTLEQGTNIYYSDLPESIIPMQDKLSGVRRISTIAQGAFTFFPMDVREMDFVANGGYFGTVNTKIGYAVNQTRVEYYGMTTAIADVGVRMDILIPFSKYAEDDEVKIPEITQVTGTNYQKKSETFVDRVMSILGITPNVDTKDDNASGGIQKDN